MKSAFALALLFGACQSPADDAAADAAAGSIHELADESGISYAEFVRGVFREPEGCVFVIDSDRTDDPCREPPAEDAPADPCPEPPADDAPADATRGCTPADPPADDAPARQPADEMPA